MDLKKIRNETLLTQYLFEKSGRLGVPLNISFELSPVCNFSCRMCYVRKTAKEVTAHERPIMTLERWLELAEQAKKAGILYLLLTGGEPFLWPDFWTLYERLQEMGFVISINTNGSLIDDEVVTRLRAKPPARVNVTLYGVSNETYYNLCGIHGAFDKVDRAITRLREAGILVKLNCSLTPQNAGDLEEIVRYAKERDLVLSVETYMLPPLRRDDAQIGQNQRFTPEEAVKHRLKCLRLQRGEAAYQKVLENIRRGATLPPSVDESCVDPVDGKIRCRAGKTSSWVTWDGWLNACGLMPEPRIDLTGKSFAQAWQELTQATRAVTMSGICKRCPSNELCQPCAAAVITETGTPLGIPKYLCQMVEAMKTLAQQELSQ